MRSAVRCVLILAALLGADVAAGQELATITADRANVRATPSIDASIIATLPKGGTVRVLERAEAWTKVSAGTVTGWVRENMLSAGRPQGVTTAAPATSTASSPSTASNAQVERRQPRRSEQAPVRAFDGAGPFSPGATFLGAHVAMSGVGSTAAVGVNGEVAYSDRVGIGALVDTWSFSDAYSAYGYSWNVRYIAIAGTGAYHFAVPSTPKLDPFVGAAIGYFLVRVAERSAFDYAYTGGDSRLFVGGFGGVRYLLSNNVAGVARAGFGSAYLTVGVDVKLK